MLFNTRMQKTTPIRNLDQLFLLKKSLSKDKLRDLSNLIKRFAFLYKHLNQEGHDGPKLFIQYHCK